MYQIINGCERRSCLQRIIKLGKFSFNVQSAIKGMKNVTQFKREITKQFTKNTNMTDISQ